MIAGTACALAAAVLTPAAGAGPDARAAEKRLTPGLLARLAGMDAGDRLRVVVRLRARPTARRMRRLAARVGPLRRARRLPGTRSFAATLTKRQVRTLTRVPGVRRIGVRAKRRGLGDQAEPSPGVLGPGLLAPTAVLTEAIAPPPPGLVAAYSFDEGAGASVPDASGNGNTGAIAGAAWNAGGRFGGALAFDGVDDWVTVADADSLDLRAMTLEAWVRPAALGPRWRTAVLKEHTGTLAYALYAHNARQGRPSAHVYLDRSRELAAGGPLPLGTWTHLAASYDGAALRLYADGVLTGTFARSGTIAAAAGPLRIGGNALWNEFFHGLIDEVRVYSRALSQAEIQADMHMSVGDIPDTSAPTTPALTLTEDEPDQHSAGTTLYYNPGPGNAGTFGVTAETGDPESGIDRVAFGGGGGDDADPPYRADYSWTSETSTAGPRTVTAHNRAGLTASSTFTVTPDGTPPTGHAVALAGGPYFTSPHIPLTTTDGTDAGAGLDPAGRRLERASAPLAGGTCGTYGPYADPDTAVETGRCYRHRLSTADRVGNRSDWSETGEAKVDATAPSAPALAFGSLAGAVARGSTVYFRPGAPGGFTVAADSSDAESGIAGYAYPALGAGWSNTGGAYSFNGSAGEPAGPHAVTATNRAGLASPASSFEVAADADPPATSLDCECTDGWHVRAPVTVALSATDAAGAGVDRIVYTTDGSEPGPQNGRVYDGPFDVAATTTIRFRASDRLGNAEPTRTRLIRIDPSAPTTPALTLGEDEPDQHAAGTTLYYNPAPGNAGTFTVAAGTDDPESGIERVAFGGGGGDDADPPYRTDYTWTSETSTAGPRTVTAHNRAGLTASSTFTVTPDGTPPTGHAVALSGGPYLTSLHVPLTITDGSDAGAGPDPGGHLLQRASAPLVDGACGTYGPYAHPDTAVQTGRCYRHRLSTADRVGNRSDWAETGDAKIDATAPAEPTVSLSESAPNAHADGTTLYYDPSAGAGSFTVSAEASDAESGIETVSFGAHGDDETPPYARTIELDGSGPRTVTARNRAGLAAGAVYRLVLDTTGPEPFSIEAPGTVRRGQTLTASPADALSGVAEVEFRYCAASACATIGTDGAPPFAVAWDVQPADGAYTLLARATDRVGNATDSAPAPVGVDNTAPDAALAVDELARPDLQHFEAGTLHYNPAARGTFRIVAAASDASGVRSVDFPEISAPGFGGPPRHDASSPFESAVYEFDASSTTAPAGRAAIVTDEAGNTAPAQIAFARDTAAPAGGSIAYPDGYDADGSVTIAAADGTDAGSGVGSAATERRLAPLTAAGCGEYGAWSPVTTPDAPPSATCAQYRHRVADRVGNEAVHESGHVVRVDTRAPAPPGNLTRAGATDTSLELAWTAPEDDVAVTGYRVQRDGSPPETTTATTHAFGDLSCGTTYGFTVRALDAAGNASEPAAIDVATRPCPSADGLVAAYGFDEGEGTNAADASGAGNTGTIAGAAWTPDGRFSGALAFDGVDDWVTIADADSLDLARMTLEAWVRPASLGPRWRTVLLKENGLGLAYALYAHNTRQGRPSAHVQLDRSRELAGGDPLPLGAWTHLAAAYDGTALRLYVNGELAGTLGRSGTIAAATGPLRIGGNSIWNEFFHGLIDEVRVYSRARSQTEIQADMNTAVGELPDASAPTTPALAIAESGPHQHADGTTVYYGPGAGRAGSFTVGAQTGDPESGIARVGFPAVFGADGGDDAKAPYEATYAWAGAATAEGSFPVTAENGARLASSAAFDVRPDTTPPAGGSVEYPDGEDADGTVTVAGVAGSDGGAGIDPGSGVLERQTAPLDGEGCAGFGPWLPAASPDTLAFRGCARYRFRVSDHVGNEATYTSPHVVRTAEGDGSPPPPLDLAIAETSPDQHVAGGTLYYNPSAGHSGTFTVATATADPESGIARVRFPAVFGADGADDTQAPYEATYAWTDAATAAGGFAVTAESGTGLTATESFGVVADDTGPEGVSLDHTGGYEPGAIDVRADPGTDAGAGVDAASLVIERRSAPFAGEDCAEFEGPWTEAVLIDGRDTFVAENTCYRYRVRVADNVGNVTTAGTNDTAKVDLTPPSPPTGLAVQSATETSVSLAWTAATDNGRVGGYEISRGGTALGTTWTTAYTVRNLACGTDYVVTVRAVDLARHPSAAATLPVSTAPCTAPAPAADVFLSPDGSDTSACTADAPCRSVARGYRAAQPGQTVQLAGGAYGGQETVPADPAKGAGADIVFRPAPGAVAELESLDVFGSHVVFRDVRIARDFYVKCGADDVTLRDSVAGLFIIASASNVSLIDSEFGPVANTHSRIQDAGDEGCGQNTSSDVLLDRVYMHDNYTVPHDASHMECLTVQTAARLTIRNSRFHRCEDFGILFKRNDPSGHHSDLLIENNWFDAPYPDGTTTIQFSTPLDGATYTNVLVRNNSFGSKLTMNPDATFTNVRFTGNVGTNVPCLGAVVFRHNVWEDGPACGATDIVAPMGYADRLGFDFHLAPGAAAIGHGDPADHPADDIDGDPRPLGLPDAGADERP